MGSVWVFALNFKLTIACFALLFCLAVYRNLKRGIPLRSQWCREKFPILGFGMVIAGAVAFIVVIALNEVVKHPFPFLDLALAAVFLGIFLVGLVAGKAKDGSTGIEFGPSM